MIADFAASSTLLKPSSASENFLSAKKVVLFFQRHSCLPCMSHKDPASLQACTLVLFFPATNCSNENYYNN